MCACKYFKGTSGGQLLPEEQVKGRYTYRVVYRSWKRLVCQPGTHKIPHISSNFAFLHLQSSDNWLRRWLPNTMGNNYQINLWKSYLETVEHRTQSSSCKTRLNQAEKEIKTTSQWHFFFFIRVSKVSNESTHQLTITIWTFFLDPLEFSVCFQNDHVYIVQRGA